MTRDERAKLFQAMEYVCDHLPDLATHLRVFAQKNHLENDPAYTYVAEVEKGCELANEMYELVINRKKWKNKN